MYLCVMIKDFDINKIVIEIEGVDPKDYPDFSDAYVSVAYYDGKEMTEEQIEWFEQEYSDYIFEHIQNMILWI